MKLQSEHKIMSSVLLWVTNALLDKGEAFSNFSGYFYDVKDVWNGYNTYALPYQPLVTDASIPNARIMSGIYLDSTFITTGVSGLVDINYEKGQIYFSSGVANSRLSGNYAIAEYNVKITDQPEEMLLFETKYELKTKVGAAPSTGLQNNDLTFPVIFLKDFGGRSDPFAFGGLDQQMINVRMIVLGDSQYSVDGVKSIFKDKTRTLIPLLTGVNEMPFNHLGGFANGQYNYRALTTGRHAISNCLWLDEVSVSSLPGSAYSEIRKLNPHVFTALIDLSINCYRNPRTA